MIEKEKKTARGQPASALPAQKQTGVTTQPEDQLTLALKGFAAYRRDEAIQRARVNVRAQFERKLQKAIKSGAAARQAAKKTGKP